MKRVIVFLTMVVIGIFLTGCQPGTLGGYDKDVLEGQVCIPPERAAELGLIELPEDAEDTSLLDELLPSDVVINEEDTGTAEEGSEISEEPEAMQEEPEAIEEALDTSGLPTKTVSEGELISFAGLEAVDPDGDELTYTFTEPLDENGEWQTTPGDAGSYVVTITVSDGKSETSQDILLVVESSNSAPEFEAIDDITVKEGDIVMFDPVATDADGDEIEITYSGWMTSDVYETNYNDAGEYIVTVTATDGISETSQDVTVIVENVNRAPVLSDIEDISLDEGELAEVVFMAVDLDNDELVYTFSEPIDADGTWQTSEGDAGEYLATITVSDGTDEDTKAFKIIVNALNNPPVMEEIADITVEEGEVVMFDPVVTDEDGDSVTVTYSGWMTEAEYETSFEDAGEYIVTVTATDDISETSQDVTVIVEDVNRAPTLDLSGLI